MSKTHREITSRTRQEPGERREPVVRLATKCSNCGTGLQSLRVNLHPAVLRAIDSLDPLYGQTREERVELILKRFLTDGDPLFERDPDED